MGWIRKALSAITLSVALASGCSMFENDVEEKAKKEKAMNRNGYLKDCEKKLGEYKKMAKLYDDKDFLKSLSSERWCSKERYDEHEDVTELRYLIRRKSLAFCKNNYNEALKQSQQYKDHAGRLALRKIEKVCADTAKGNYDSAKVYMEYANGLTNSKKTEQPKK